MFSTDVFTKATSAKNAEQKTRVEIQASFTLESVSDGKQKFSLENLYIILPENIESVSKNETKQANDIVTTPVKPVTKTIPSAPVKSYPKNVSSNAVKGDENTTCQCISCTLTRNRENDNRLCLLQKLFDENKYQWKDEYLNDYKKWSTTFEGATHMNRYKKMVQFINENRSNFTKTI